MIFTGPSVDSLAGLQDGLADDVSGEELFGVARLLRSSAGLRRVLTDVSILGSAKAGLIHQMLDDQVSAPVVELTAQAVQRRWRQGRDLPDALEQLGVVAVVRSCDEPARLADELFGVGELVRRSAGLRDALSDPARSTTDRRALVDSLLADKVLPETAALARQSLEGTYRTLEVALVDYERLAASVARQSVAIVRVATPLAQGDRDRLAAALERQYDRPVHLNVVVDPEVLGGVLVEIGDDVIDGTVAGRLDDARRRLAG